ncbi:MAG: hypothetical protein COA58_08510 [Bacteroidetes bacterium]|nr:MAG: hypothetical protein COA58_08510 [Bacteroidota bacterium]
MRLSLLGILAFLTFVTFAQRQNGMVADNYAGYTASQFNPANLADSRFKFNMNVIGFNAHLQNNFIQLETPHSIYKFINWKWDSTFGTQNFDYPFVEDYTKERLNGKDKYVYLNTSVNVFSMQFCLTDKSGFSFGVTTKAYAKVSNLPEAAIKTFLQDLDSVGYVKENQERLLGQTINLSKAGAATLAYQQYSLKYAFVVKDKRKEFIKVGLGLDYNLGLYGAYFKSNDVEFQLSGIDTLKVNSADMEIAYVDPAYLADPARRLNDYFGKSRLGRGLGINVGIVYEHRPNSKAYKYKMDRRTHVDRSQNKYDWKIAASIVDLGFVNFKNPKAVRKLTIGSPASGTNWNDFDVADSWNGVEDFDSFANKFFSNVQQDSSFKMFTPATLNLSGDYKFRDNWYISASYSQSLTSSKGNNVKMPNVLSISPRYESRWLTIALPLSVSRYYNVVNLGAYVRGGIFYIGSDNLGGFLTGKKTNGANIYAGFNWPIHYNRLQDSDGDGVSDDKDKCPDMEGSRYTNGCPDSDGDKVADTDDKCPNDPGKKRTFGCPDPDEDGLVGKDDKCPDLYGDKSTQGCPDSDGDGIHDGDDKCPNIAGELKYNGCIELIIPKKDAVPKDTIVLNQKSTKKADEEASKFDNWDFTTYEYWPVLGAYNDLRWAEELQSRLNSKLDINTTVKTIEGLSKYYVTLGRASSMEEAEKIQNILDTPRINKELNGSLWWKKVKK